ncbi:MULTISPECIES: hypothetical protein [Chitinophagaceae]|uniref:hypothetical protein n=1 Tax=Chitinophagaceae TaxID=563835 RepID=UPI000DEEED59|nr:MULTISPECIES: hypothetical protein [Chitinophagaceae]RPD51515.1 hypothetical protein DRJ53_02215 [Paracnuella aquatica]
MAEQRFELLVDKVPYQITAEPFTFNEETRFRVTYNGSDEHIMAYDTSLGRFAAIDDDAGTIPDTVERAIAEKLAGGRTYA